MTNLAKAGTIAFVALAIAASAHAAEVIIFPALEYIDLQDAVDDAIARSQFGAVELWIEEGTYIVSETTIAAGSNITIRGMGAYPPKVVLDGAGAADHIFLIEVSGIVIENLTLTGAVNEAVQVNGGTDFTVDPITPTVGACYIHDNGDAASPLVTGHGIWVDGNAAPDIVNCAIGKNLGDGIRIESGAFADIRFCSIIDNGDSGVHAVAGGDARVRNSLIYSNGDGVVLGAPGALDGGIVWDVSQVAISPQAMAIDRVALDLVTITGSGLFPAGSPDTTRVFFGPPSVAGTEWTFNSAPDAQSMDGYAPAPYTGAPGPVDVYIVRADGFTHVLPNGFAYLSPAASSPTVSAITPASGPPEGGNFVIIDGADFDQGCRVRFDAQYSTLVERFSPTRLRVRVPDSGGTGDSTVQVRVRNTLGGESAPAPYDYLASLAGCRAPAIYFTVPGVISAAQAASAPGGIFNIQVYGGNLLPGCTVELDGTSLTYQEVVAYDIYGSETTDFSGATTLLLDGYGRIVTTIKNVEIPVALIAGGGWFDLTVTNPAPCGLTDTLPEALGHFPDRKPVIDYIAPNHALAEPTDPVYATIQGANFDGRVEVIFDYAGNQVAVTTFTTSPTQLVVRVPSANDFSPSLVPLPANPLLIDVMVRNSDAGIVATPAERTSDPAPFYFYELPEVPVEPTAGPDLLFNDVYANYLDYVKVSPGVGSISVDPYLDWGIQNNDPVMSTPSSETWWLGKILPGSPLVNQAGDFADNPNSDLENDPRPLPGELSFGAEVFEAYDIGADEVYDGRYAELVWYYCYVAPNPVGRYNFAVEVRVTGTEGLGGDVAVGFLHQGSALPLFFEDFAYGAQESVGRGVWQCELDLNAFLADNGDWNQPTSLPEEILDGHAMVVVHKPDRTPFGPLEMTIGAQAIEGRHFLIDTEPPRLKLLPLGSNPDYFMVDPPVAYGLAVARDYGVYLDLAYVIEDVNHIYPFLYPGGAFQPNYPQFDSGEPAPMAGVISYAEPTRNAYIFFNTGSRSNNLPPQRLLLGVHAEFEDGHEFPQGIDPMDLAGPAVDRPPAGFTSTPVPLLGPPREVLTGPYPAHWYPSPAMNYPTFTAANAVFTTGGNDITYPWPGADEILAKDEILSDWTFYEGDAGGEPILPLNPGISMLLPGTSDFHLPVQFRGIDRAGNVSNDNVGTLHIWWLLDTGARLWPNLEGKEVRMPAFTWELERPALVEMDSPPLPIFTYRMYASDAYAGDLDPGDGLLKYWYVDDPGVAPRLYNWSDWDTTTRLDYETDFENTGLTELYGGKWILLVLIGADEAGNVEPWPAGLILNGDGSVTVNASSGANWQRFKLLGAGEEVDTTLTATFWHNASPYNNTIDTGEESFGAATIVPFPEDPNVRVEVKFRIGLLLPEGVNFSDPGVDPRVEWALYENATLLDSAVINTLQTTVTIQLPEDSAAVALLGDDNPDPDQREPVTYVFNAKTIADINTDGTDEKDATPASYQFVVVPAAHAGDYGTGDTGGVGAFVDPKDSPDSQPVKRVEHE
ncbi:MAG TPA: hypothetical protein HPP77_03310 [Candidatus Hydrogenedentes bacterium]|nr:hypothetical protein [Candidatus Hydrogenedentota bacterium]